MRVWRITSWLMLHVRWKKTCSDWRWNYRYSGTPELGMQNMTFLEYASGLQFSCSKTAREYFEAWKLTDCTPLQSTDTQTQRHCGVQQSEPYSFYFHVFSVSSSAVSCGSRDWPVRCHCACARDSVLSGKIYRRQQERRSAIDKHRVERTGSTTVLSSPFYYFILMSSVVSVENSYPTKGAGVPFKRGSSWGKGSIRGSILFGGKSGWMNCRMGERMDG